MAIIRQGGYTDNDSSDKLREKRKKIIEEERIFQLKESLMAFYEKLLEKYDVIDKEQNEEGDVKHPTREEIETFTQEYADSKPKGF
jgi:Mg2+ and Co2+ transporter CorA